MNAKVAREFLPDTIHRLKQSKIPEFKPFITTLKKWQEEIIQSFIEVDEVTGEVIRPHYSNAIIEGMNNKVKVINRVNYGYI